MQDALDRVVKSDMRSNREGVVHCVLAVDYIYKESKGLSRHSLLLGLNFRVISFLSSGRKDQGMFCSVLRLDLLHKAWTPLGSCYVILNHVIIIASQVSTAIVVYCKLIIVVRNINTHIKISHSN